jgi:cobalt-zinc-cadmium efflux system membrane fusion protein
MTTMKINTYITLLIYSLLIGTGCGKKPSQDKLPTEENHTENTVELTAEQYTTAGIETGLIETQQISGTIKVNGMLDVPPQQKVSISLPFGGFLKNTEMLQGMKVKKGQIIAQIENPDFIQIQQDFLDYESQLEFAKAEYERQQTLATENVNSLKTLQQAKSNYLSLLAKYNGLGAKLKLMNIQPKNIQNEFFTSTANIYSPISGYITRINANIGMFLNPTDVLFEIVDTKHLHAELTVFEKDISLLEIGQKVKFILANESEERLATVYLIGREIKSDRTVNVHCHLDAEDTDLIPGTYLKAYIETGANQVPALPDEAIVKYQGKKYIFAEAAEKYHFTMMEIETGNSDHGYTELILPADFNTKTTQIVKVGAYDVLGKMMNSEESGGHAH